jgi:uncharacterized membrane-anchored protein YhcB (DUF1043 family)
MIWLIGAFVIVIGITIGFLLGMYASSVDRAATEERLREQISNLRVERQMLRGVVDPVAAERIRLELIMERGE